MTPIRTRESNFTYLGPSAEIADLPCSRKGLNTFCIWELTAEEREAIAAGGRIQLGIYGVQPIPPVSLQVAENDGPFERVAAPCDICSQEAEHEVHKVGPGTHAFRCRKR